MVHKGRGVNKLVRDNKGMSMVNVVAAFAIFMIASSIFAQAVRLSLNFISHSDEVRDQTNQAIYLYYTGTPSGVDGNINLDFSGEDGSFRISLKGSEGEYGGFTFYRYGY